MSRNLGQTDCDRCRGIVAITGERHHITREEAHVYFDEFEGLVVADADCTKCGAKYIAWVDGRPRTRPVGVYGVDLAQEKGAGEFFDLSYRATFNDEASSEDLPPIPAAVESRKDNTMTLGEACQKVFDAHAREFICPDCAGVPEKCNLCAAIENLVAVSQAYACDRVYPKIGRNEFLTARLGYMAEMRDAYGYTDEQMMNAVNLSDSMQVQLLLAEYDQSHPPFEEVQVMVKIDGKTWRWRLERADEDRYRCNGCGSMYVAE